MKLPRSYGGTLISLHVGLFLVLRWLRSYVKIEVMMKVRPGRLFLLLTSEEIQYPFKSFNLRKETYEPFPATGTN